MVLLLTLSPWSQPVLADASASDERLETLQSLLQGSYQNYVVDGVFLIDSCQLVWVTSRETSCENPRRNTGNAYSIDLRDLTFWRRLDMWSTVYVAFRGAPRGIGDVQNTPFNMDETIDANDIIAISNHLGTRNFEFSSYCGINGRARSGASGIPIQLTGQRADQFEALLIELMEICEVQ